MRGEIPSDHEASSFEKRNFSTSRFCGFGFFTSTASPTNYGSCFRTVALFITITSMKNPRRHCHRRLCGGPRLRLFRIAHGSLAAAVAEHQVRERSATEWSRNLDVIKLRGAVAPCLSALLRVLPQAEDDRGHGAGLDAGIVALLRNHVEPLHGVARLVELRHLLTALLWLGWHGIEHPLHWSEWRRRHQFRAMCSHYRKCGSPLPVHYLQL